jgi:aspartate/methionine/tyrosine aminotransferase
VLGKSALPYSRRLPRDLSPNRLAAAVRRRVAEARPFVDLTLSNPTAAGFDYPADLLAPLAASAALEYRPEPLGMARAREAVARDYARQGVEVSADRIVLTASSSEAYSLLFKLLADAGDEVLVPRPSYPLFDHLTRLDLVTAVPYELDHHDGWSVDVAAIARQVGARTRAVLVVSPNNPTGTLIGRQPLDRLAALCAERGIALVAAEVFADYELEPGALAGAGRAAARTDALTFALGGLSKSVGLPQVKLGWMAVGGPAADAAEALRRLEVIADTYLSVSTPVQVAAEQLLVRGAAVRADIAGRVRANYLALHAAAAAVPSCRAARSDAGWYAVIQVPTFEPEDDLALRLLELGVLAHPGYFFDFPRESFLVVSLLPPPGEFARGIDIILRHFACTDAVNRDV